ncbi:hypothetical protein ACFLU0_00415 [Chloroflexota bacterium]
MAKRILLIIMVVLGITLVGCDYLENLSEPKSSSEQFEYSAEQMKADLIGHVLVVNGQLAWEFAALSEYEQFEIIGQQTQGNVVEFDVTMKLKDFATNIHYHVEVFIVYKDIDGKWELVSLVTKLFEFIENGETLY